MIVYLQMIDTSEDRSKFEQLYLEYRGLMFHAANQILHNEQDAEDAVHQAFLSIAQHIQNIDQPISSKTRCYVVTITENKAIDQYRRRQKHPTVELQEGLAGVQVSYEGENLLAACILKLPARYRNDLAAVSSGLQRQRGSSPDGLVLFRCFQSGTAGQAQAERTL